MYNPLNVTGSNMHQIRMFTGNYIIEMLTNSGHLTGEIILWGGRPKEHNIAQVDSWQRILNFLRKELQPDKHLQRRRIEAKL